MVIVFLKHVMMCQISVPPAWSVEFPEDLMHFWKEIPAYWCFLVAEIEWSFCEGDTELDLIR